MRWCFWIFCLGMVAGCSADILHDLDEAEANHILDTLLQRGIAATKTRTTAGTKVGYTLSVPSDDAPRSWQLLRQYGLPRIKPKGLGEIFGKVGLVPTATQERALLRHALAGEISQTLTAVEGVYQARVHVVIPERDPLSPPDTATKAPRASVLLIVGKTSPLSEDDVKKLVAGGLDGLKADAISVVISTQTNVGPRGQSTQPLVSVGPFFVARASRTALVVTLVSLVVTTVSFCIFLLILYRRNRANRASRPLFDADSRGQMDPEISERLSLIEHSVVRYPSKDS
jgi:type III secretion protein J